MIKPSNIVFVGTYTRRESFVNGRGEGIYICQLDPITGKLFIIDVVESGINPSFLTLSPDKKNLYAVNEITPTSGESGLVSAFEIDLFGKRLSFKNRESTHGFAPCHLSVDPTGRYLLVANYLSGSLCSLPVLPDGSLGKASHVIQHHGCGTHSTRQAGPHAHMIAASPDDDFVLATDLGTDEFLVYSLDDETGYLNPVHNMQVKLPAGSGPRHFSFHPNGRFVFVNGELNSTLTAFEFNPESGMLNPIQHLSTIPDSYVGASTGAEIAVHPSGKYIYASNRGHDSIAIFQIDQDNGELHPIGYVASQGRVPRSFTIDPSGEFMLVGNQDSNNIVTFRIDLGSGQLNAVDECALPTPVCILCLKSE